MKRLFGQVNSRPCMCLSQHVCTSSQLPTNPNGGRKYHWVVEHLKSIFPFNKVCLQIGHLELLPNHTIMMLSLSHALRCAQSKHLLQYIVFYC